MLVPDSPGTTDLPLAFERLQQTASPFATPGTGITADAYEALDVAAQMALLNVEAKLRETSVDGSPLMSFVKGITHVAVDRVFVLFDPALKARMPRAGEFAGAPGHGAPKSCSCRRTRTVGSTCGIPKGISSYRFPRTRRPSAA